MNQQDRLQLVKERVRAFTQEETIAPLLEYTGILAKMGTPQFGPGSLFANRFEIKRAAGSGGMGTVYRAVDRYSGDAVALKLLHSGAGAQDEAERFAREAQLLSELRHPGIVAHVAHGQAPDGQRFLAMEWLEGQDLGERLTRGPLPIRDCLRLLKQVADALAVPHQRGIIHRDLKPTNLFLIDGDVGRVKILDFGIARYFATSQAMTRSGIVIGTPEYMAPEQARGSRDLTPAADLFSLGCVLYECLTGRPPFVADHVAAVLVRILFEEPVPVEDCRLGVPAALSALLGRLLNKDPAQRLADAAALGIDLLSLGELPEPALAVTMASPRPKPEIFAEKEQSLFSIVLAAPKEEEIKLGATQLGSGVQLTATDRRALLQALTALGGSPDFLANGTLVVTVPPRGSAQDQATLAARAALLIKELWPAAIVSMATGRGSIRGRTAVGEVVELAARSLKNGSHSSVTKPATGVLIDPLSAKLLAGRFAQTPQPGGALLLREEPDIDASRPLLGKPTPCVGREVELGNLEAQLTACIEDSEARVVLFTASPGAGKSRLRHEFLRHVEKRSEPITVLLGRGDMMSAGAPYGILRAALHMLCGISGSEPLDTQRDRLRTRIALHLAADAERIVLFVGELCNVPFPEEGKPMLQAARQDPKIMRDRLRRSLLDFLAAECAVAPVLLVLDDLQWCDELTVSVLDEALREQAGSSLFVLSFARPEVHETFPKLWQSHKLQEISLKGLSKRACERLIVQVLGKNVTPAAMARAIEQSAGNALFLEELVRSIAEGQSEPHSETVVAMLQARLGRLDSNLRRAIRAAAVFGQTFWRGGVAAILGLAEMAAEVDSWLSALVDSELIQPHAQSRLAKQSEYGFRHALVRDATYSLLTDSDLHTGHRLAGGFLETACEPNFATIGEHLERGGELERAAGYYLRAAEQNQERGNLNGALRELEQGLSCQPQGELRGQLLGLRSWTEAFLNRFDRVETDSRMAIELLRAGSRVWCRAIYAAFLVATLLRGENQISTLVTMMIATPPCEDTLATYADTLGYFIIVLNVIAPPFIIQALMERLEAIVAKAEAVEPTIARSLHLARATNAMWRRPQPWRAIIDSNRARELAHTAGDSRVELIVLGNLVELGWRDLGDVDRACQRMRLLQEEMQKSQEVALITLWRLMLGQLLCDMPNSACWDEAEVVIRPILTVTQGLPLFRAMAEGILGRIALLRGHPHLAEAHACVAMETFSTVPVFMMDAASVQVRALIALGRGAEASTLAKQVLSVLQLLGGAGHSEVELRLAASEAYYAAGDLECARTGLHETLRQIQLRADDISDPFWKGSYLTRNPYCVRAQEMAKAWGLAIVVQ